MCGRYFLKLDDTYEAFLRLKERIKQMYMSEYSEGEIFPTQPVLTLLPKGMDDYQPEVLTWGMNIGKSKRVINARQETMNSRPAFRTNTQNRCVIVANGFYEWQGEKGHKQKIQIERTAEPMYMAGIYNSQKEMVIITGASEDEMATIHDRSPYIMNEKEMLAYLHFQHDFLMNDRDLKFTNLNPSNHQQTSLF